jgi:hypothetical protein
LPTLEKVDLLRGLFVAAEAPSINVVHGWARAWAETKRFMYSSSLLRYEQKQYPNQIKCS